MQIKKFKLMFISLFIFYSLAIFFCIIYKSIFDLVNFVILGTSVALGFGLWPVLPKMQKEIARKISQFLVGGYIFFGLGLGFMNLLFGHLIPENMQIEGFWFLLFAGLFQAATIHFVIAKIIGPFLCGRVYCGWMCWTAAILDILPYKKPEPRINKRFEIIRYLFFIISFSIVFVLVFVFNYGHKDIAGMVELSGKSNNVYSHLYTNYFLIPEAQWFLIGNLAYYFLGIILAFILKDNRAFCKYVCPITFFLKIGTRFSIVKITADKNKCNDCKLCEKNCLMNIKLTQYIIEEKRILSTECILCNSCISTCPKEALKMKSGFDFGFKEYITRRK